MKLKVAVSKLPERYREVLRTGRVPSNEGDDKPSYRTQPAAPWVYFALKPGAEPSLGNMLLVTIVLSLALFALMLYAVQLAEVHCWEAWPVLSDFKLISGVAVTVVLLAMFRESLTLMRHQAHHRFAHQSGLAHYGLYLSEEHILLRRVIEAQSAFLIPRSQVKRIVRVDVRPTPGRSSPADWQVEVHAMEGPKRTTFVLAERDFEGGERLESALVDWLARGPAPAEPVRR